MSVPALWPPFFTASFETTTFRLSAWPSIVLVLVLLLAIFLMRDLAAKSPGPSYVKFFSLGAGGFPGLFLAIATTASTCESETSARKLFEPALYLDSFLELVGCMLLLSAVILAYRCTPPATRSLPAITGVCFALVAGAFGHGQWVRRLGALPCMEFTGPGVVHTRPIARVGVHLSYCYVHRADAPAVSSSPPSEFTTRWTADEAIEVAAATPGTRTIVARARRGLITVESTLQLRTAQELGSPAFPLRVGNEWNFIESENSGAQVLFVISNEHTERRSLTLRISQANVVEGLRRFTLSVGGSTELQLVAVDGETMLLHQGRLKRFLTFEQPPSAGAAAPCTLQLPNEIHGWCDLPRGNELAGPRSWSISRSAGVGTPLLIILTGGVVIPHGTTMHARRVSTTTGPADSPEAPLASWQSLGVPPDTTIPVPKVQPAVQTANGTTAQTPEQPPIRIPSRRNRSRNRSR